MMALGSATPRGAGAWAGALAVLALVSVLAGCASQRALPPPVTPATPPPAAPSIDPWARPLADFDARQRLVAETAGAQGRWAEAISAWDVLRALHPEDESLAGRQAQARASAAWAASERMQRARQAQQRGDADGATRSYLEVLALVPAQPEASEALRAIERERVKRQQLGQLSRYTVARVGAGALQAGETAAGGLPAGANEIEHARLLAEQGELASAIALLKPLADKRGADPVVRQMLAEMNYRQGEALARSNPPAAKAALERCLQLDPKHAGALALLRLMRSPHASVPIKP